MTGGLPTILLADDEPFLRALVRATLGSSYQLIEAEDGAEALDLTRRHRPSVALIDGQMPKIDGFAVCQSLKSDPLTNHIPIIMLTARTSAADRELGAAAGADGYLTKPFSPANLLATVEQALTRVDIPEVESAELPDATPVSGPPAPEIGPEEQERPAETSPELAQILAYARELGSLYESARTHAAHFRQLAEISRELVSARNTGGVIQLALERSTAFSGYESGSVLMVGTDGTLEVRASIGPDAAPPGSRVDAITRSVAGRALHQRRALQLEGRGEEIGVAWRSYTKPIPSAICLPLITSGDEAIGVLALKSVSSYRRLDAHDLDALQLLAAQLAAAIESALLHEQLRDLVGRLLVAQEDERRRVAYEVHDGLAQVATSAHQHLQAFARQYRPRSSEARDALDRALDLAQRTVRETRQVIGDLRPTALDDFGLAAALRLELERWEAQGWDITYDESLGGERVSQNIETALFRIAQEALTNVRKHADSRRVDVSLRRQGANIELEVRDFGKGFQVKELGRGGPGERVGLTGMQERVALLGGRWRIESHPGNGTRVVAEVPAPISMTESPASFRIGG